ncbi:MAG: phosphatase family protein [Caulobacteraceae bacterium]|nr:phosphatase family protein [Caulobacteraceae bacterium]
MTNRLALLAMTAAASLVLAAGAIAADAPAAAPTMARPAKTLHVLTPEQVDPARLLPAPAADGSDQQKAELAEVQRLYKTRTPARHAQADWDDKHETAELFFATLGPKFDLAKLPATAKMLAVVENEQSVVANIAKRHFLRNRPWAIDATLVACDYKPNAAPLTSYPSGHATLSYSEGYVLAALMPEKATAIMSRAAEYAYSREVCAAHYASDTEASHVLGTEVAMLMMQNPGFAAQVEASRAELRAAGLTSR